MTTFLENLKQQASMKQTQNGANTYGTSGSKVLDYFAQGSSLRFRPIDEIECLFEKAFEENPLLALKILFYSRDIRGGQGERHAFRVILRSLASKHTETLVKNLHLIPEFGRWDDLFVLLNTKVHYEVISIISRQLTEDIESEHPSLLGKWMKSENTSSEESRKIAKCLRASLGLSPRAYRKLLSNLRMKIDIVERKLSSKDYESINFEKLPSKAMLKYKKAFAKHCDHYQNYLDSLSRGEAKVNVKALYPYELVREALRNYADESHVSLINSMWDKLPDYINEDDTNLLAVIDVSGSMECSNSVPLYMAISLGLYISEKNKGAFGNHFLTFSDYPQLVEVKGKNFFEKVWNIRRADWGGSTNLERTFDLILDTAIKNKMSQEDLPEKLFIISDMEFNSCEGWRGTPYTTMELIEKKFKAYGYKVPKLVFWNVDSKQDNIPSVDRGVQLVSGANPIIFENLLKGKSLEAYDLMLLEIGKPRYDVVSV